MNSHTSILIGIDGNEANVQNRVGSNWYAHEVLKALYRYPEGNRYLIYLKAKPLGDLPRERADWHYRVLRPGKAWTQWRLPLDLYVHYPRPQVFYCPGHYAPRKSPVPVVITILDVAYLIYPNLFLKGERGYLQLKLWTQYSVNLSRRIITISQNSRQDILTHYQYPEDRITVAYPGIDTQKFGPENPAVIQSVLGKHHLESPYLLSVGTLQPRKNLVRLVEAFEQLPPRFRDLHLVFAGGQGWLMAEFNRKVSLSPVKDRLHLLGYVPDADLPALYTGASALVLVGLHEGFGIPAAEAIACGTIPIVARTASLPEVVGQGGIVVDPFSVTGIKNGIITAAGLSVRDRQERLILGKRHIAQFTWERAAHTILEALYAVTL